MAAGVYTVEFEHQTIAAASGDYDFFELRPATAGQPITVIGYEITPTTITGDADEEILRLRWLTMLGGTFTSGTGGATPTPAPTELTVADASDFAADTMNSAVATTTGTTRNHESFGVNGRVGTGLVWVPPEARISVPGASNTAIILRLMAAIATDESCSGTCWVKEGM